mmetsp:Transcript_41224/g.124461  ORF Transcript_41224/g.124461 Transcript_41224/m.124461 type:complete len:219 (-) Transcript_41224:464-1120(-)
MPSITALYNNGMSTCLSPQNPKRSRACHCTEHTELFLAPASNKRSQSSKSTTTSNCANTGLWSDSFRFGRELYAKGRTPSFRFHKMRSVQAGTRCFFEESYASVCGLSLYVGRNVMGASEKHGQKPAALSFGLSGESRIKGSNWSLRKHWSKEPLASHPSTSARVAFRRVFKSPIKKTRSYSSCRPGPCALSRLNGDSTMIRVRFFVRSPILFCCAAR